MTPKQLKEWRLKNSYSQIELARALGVTNVCISRWETGLRKIPAFLHITLKCLKVKKGGELKKKTRGTKKKKEVKR